MNSVKLKCTEGSVLPCNKWDPDRWTADIALSNDNGIPSLGVDIPMQLKVKGGGKYNSEGFLLARLDEVLETYFQYNKEWPNEFADYLESFAARLRVFAQEEGIKPGQACKNWREEL